MYVDKDEQPSERVPERSKSEDGKWLGYLVSSKLKWCRKQNTNCSFTFLTRNAAANEGALSQGKTNYRSLIFRTEHRLGR